MLRVVLKGLLAHKVRLALTTFAVVLGVSFVAGAFILTDSIDEAFANLFETTSQGTDVIVTPRSELDDPSPTFVPQVEPLPEALLAEVLAIDGVDNAVGFVQGIAQIVGPDGEAVGGNGPPQLGFSWSDELGPLVLQQGGPPTGMGQVVIDAVSAETTGYGVGDRITVVTQVGAGAFEVVGVVGFGEADNLLGATIAAFTLEQARGLFDKPGEFDEIDVVAAQGVDAAVLRDRVAEALGERAQVVTTAESNQQALADISVFLNVITGVLLGFAFVAMFVGAFIIANTFSITVAQRTREYALLRAVGASAKQVKRAVRGEALIVGAIASVLGLLLGIGFAQGLKALLDAFGFALPTGGLVLPPRTIIASFAVGMGVTLVATILPARRASRIAPVEAMRGASTAADAPLHRRTVTGLAILGLGTVVFGLGAFASIANGAAFVGLGAVLILLGVATASPVLATPIARVVGAIPARLGVAGRIAQGNAGRDWRRTAITASALMIGLSLVTFATILAASVTGSIGDTLDEQFAADFWVATQQPQFDQLPTAVADDLESLDEIGAVTRVRLAQASVDGTGTTVSGVEPTTLAGLVGLGEVEGDLAAIGPDDVFVKRAIAEDRGVAIGDPLEVVFGRTGAQTFTVAGTFELGDLLGSPYLLPLPTFAQNVTGTFDALVFADVAEGVDLVQARAAAEAVLAPFPSARLQDQAELREQTQGQVDQILGLMMVMLALAIVVALLGITNTLALAVFERTREIGLLRAVGMSRRQVRSMVRWESTIVATFGAVLGVLVGTVFGWAIVRALAEQGFSTLVIPFGQLAFYVIAAAVAGVIAAAFPARRAAKLDVLEAVTVE